MASIPFSEENVSLLEYLNRLQVTPRDKSLNNPKVQKNSLNTKFPPGVNMRQSVCVGLCVCTVHTRVAGHDKLCTGVGVKQSSESAQQDVLKGTKEWKETSVQ